MPNHVTHRLTFTANSKAEMDEFLEAISGKNDSDGDAHFDFNSIIPMPEILRGSESSSLVEIGLIILGREDLIRDSVMFPGKSRAEAYLNYPWVKEVGVKTVEELCALLDERHPSARAKGAEAIKAYEECGHIDWYSWSLENWGTKWNAYSVDLTRLDDTSVELVFDTAWSPPVPVLIAISEKFPDIGISGFCFDEGWNFACHISNEEGLGLIIADLTEKEDMILAYRKVYGEEPELDEDEEEDAR